MKKMEKALATKKQQSMSNIGLSLSALQLQCRCVLSDRKMIAVCGKSVLPFRS